jgi:hypothetical protein
MPEKRWEFDLDGARHTVELEHSTFSKVQSVRADGRLLQAPAGTPGGHTFRIAGHTCEVVVEKRGRKYAYDFLVDGVSSTQEL